MVAGRARQRHQHGRHSHRGQFGDGGGSRPAHDQVGGGIHRRHVVLVRDQVVVEGSRRLRMHTARQVLVVAVPRDVAYMEVTSVPPEVQRPGGRLVDRAGPERASEDRHQPALLVDAQSGPGRGPSGRTVSFQHLGPHRIARPGGSAQVGVLEGRGRTGRQPAQQPVGQAGYRVLLRDHQRHARQGGGHADRDRGVAAQPHHDGGLAAPQHEQRLDEGPGQFGGRGRVGGKTRAGEAALQPPSGQRSESEPGLGDQPRLDAAGAADEVHDVLRGAPASDLAGDADARQHVAGRTAAGHESPSRRG